jgi:alpha-glucoside transport system permease protein
VAPALLLELLFFLYPVFNTMVLSLASPSSIRWVGMKNYEEILTDPSLLVILRNNLLWLLLATLCTVGLGLLMAVVLDRAKAERLIQSMLFIPMAISFVGAGVIWLLVYEYRSPGKPQTGLLNAMATFFGQQPQAWLVNEPLNNVLLILVYVWMTMGLSVVILSAALKGIPEEIIETAHLDGVNQWTLFWHILLPMIRPALSVVTIAVIIGVLKTFDAVYVMTGGNYGTNVIGHRFYEELFSNGNYGMASALAVLLMLTVVPVMYFNIRRLRRQEKWRERFLTATVHRSSSKWWGRRATAAT